jgi:hypothetical protein
MTRHAESSDVLTGGQWVVVRGVSRWVPDPAPVEPPTLTVVAPLKPHWTTLVACPYCGARVAETCKTSGGGVTKPHARRLASRVCPCGAPVEKHKNYCEPCRAEARRYTRRLYASKRRDVRETRQEGAA